MAKDDIRQILKEPDEFITFTDKAVKWARANAKALLIGAAAAVLLIGAGVGLRSYASHRDAQAMDKLGPVMLVYEKYLGGQIDGPALQTMREALGMIADEYSATPAGRQARLALAQTLFNQGEYDQAAQEFAALGQDSSLEAELLPLALHGQAQSQEALGKYDEAQKSYQRAIQAAGPDLAALYALDRARALAAAGDQAGAVALYEKALQGGPDDQSRQTIVAALARLGHAVADEQPPADPVQPQPAP